MKTLNIQIDENLYETIKTIGFIKKKPMSVVVRESLEHTVTLQPKALKEKMILIMDKQDETHINKILAEDDWVSQADFDKEFGFNPKDFK